ncbi:37S ribosomal protein S24, mitochondrial [Verticillium nonalfalfae]|uniref:37S ribosomal protein S24, mitochondrial n=1 Tax=Verticillium nonalfalfae TaxID=1051616 RepID=A0A3M9Y6D5_9PEZI|nr:37S ribosomal protein S24, mitochondrial [Verticillium nonalfalfae]RNJ56063.1 37S ribosomal protein S24, mitochondrial [Verticillium nonalfalfae]
MAAAGYAVRLCLRTCRQAPAARLLPTAGLSMAPRRGLTTTATTWAPGGGRNRGSANPYEHLEDAFKDLSPEQLKALEAAIREDEGPDSPASLNDFLSAEEPELRKEQAFDAQYRELIRQKPAQRSSLFYDELDPETVTEDTGAEFDEDDITSLAHGKLDEIREHRHYARVAAWEMPLLSKLAKPFEPPTKEQVLRYRYTTYMGENHPAEKKVVVQFSPADLGLTPVQANKLKKLAGTRYDPGKDTIKMSCESFDHAAQNKRYLADQVDTLVAAAKDPKDTFEDIPLDTRHYKPVVKPKFPKAWRLTPDRKKELAALRAQAKQLDAGKEAEGQLVDGQKMIDAMLGGPSIVAQQTLSKEAMAEMLVVAQRQAGPKPTKQGRN